MAGRQEAADAVLGFARGFRNDVSADFVCSSAPATLSAATAKETRP